MDYASLSDGLSVSHSLRSCVGMFIWIVEAKALSTHPVFSLPWAHIFITQAHISTGLAGLLGLVLNGMLFSVNRATRRL